MSDYVRDFFRDKKVCIVGNSVEILNYELADFIDSHDIVMRLGKGINTQDKHECLGKKFDVWSTGTFRAPMYTQKEYHEVFKNVKLILLNRNSFSLDVVLDMRRKRKNYFSQRFKLPKDITFNMYSPEEISEINASKGIQSNNENHARISNGALTIKFMCERVKTFSELNIVGFDFFRKKIKKKNQRSKSNWHWSWHQPISSSTAIDHSHGMEISIIKPFLDSGMLKWKILSDLDDEFIENVKYGDY